MEFKVKSNKLWDYSVLMGNLGIPDHRARSAQNFKRARPTPRHAGPDPDLTLDTRKSSAVGYCSDVGSTEQQCPLSLALRKETASRTTGGIIYLRPQSKAIICDWRRRPNDCATSAAIATKFMQLP